MLSINKSDYGYSICVRLPWRPGLSVLICRVDCMVWTTESALQTGKEAGMLTTRFIKVPRWYSKDPVASSFYMLKQTKDKENKSVVLAQHPLSPTQQAYNHLLSLELSLSRSSAPLKVLEKQPSYDLNPLSTVTRTLLKPYKLNRKIQTEPRLVLDAPGLLDDFYLNLVDWSTSNQLAVGLGRKIYLWNASTHESVLLSSLVVPCNDLWTSLSWMKNGTMIALGTKSGKIQVWDMVKDMLVFTIRNAHSARIGTLNWNSNVLSSGSKDHNIHNYDIRDLQGFGSIKPTFGFEAHKQEICGLKWDFPGTHLASGGNDNLVCVWDIRKSRARTKVPLHSWRDHDAAIKALDWCPSRSGWLATGGGTLDRKIMLWDVATGASIAKVDSGSQVCNMSWAPNNFPFSSYSQGNENDFELVTSHGYTQNQLILWRICPLFPSLTDMHPHTFSSRSRSGVSLASFPFFQDHQCKNTRKFVPLAHFSGHTQRVIHMAKDPTSSTIVTGSGDETLRFWKVFADKKSTLPTFKQ